MSLVNVQYSDIKVNKIAWEDGTVQTTADTYPISGGYSYQELTSTLTAAIVGGTTYDFQTNIQPTGGYVVGKTYLIEIFTENILGSSGGASRGGTMIATAATGEVANEVTQNLYGGIFCNFSTNMSFIYVCNVLPASGLLIQGITNVSTSNWVMENNVSFTELTF
jgi:hypothetical protein|tara:strand:- start:19091 stop:19585 length:495 start_codon:yes stop_codon:yes gene_type:complete